MMNLFAASGVDLPAQGTSRPGRSAPRSLRQPLFAHKVLSDLLNLDRVLFAPTKQQLDTAKSYARKARSAAFRKESEIRVRPTFINQILEQLLGYMPLDPGQSHTLAFEYPIRTGSVDVALGNFGGPDANAKGAIVAPFEIKGPGTTDLDAIMPGRGRSPIQQAWDYAIDAPGSRWVLVSNCLEIRLYGFGRGRDAYEVFDLTRLDEVEEHERLWLLLSAGRLLGGTLDKLLRDTDSAYKDVTEKLYGEYKGLRDRLIDFIVNAADGPKITALDAIEPAQKILDRVLFVAFAQRTDLLPDRLLERAAQQQNEFNPEPIWKNFTALFRGIDKGNTRLNIWPYNGGLFTEDPVADALILPDALAGEVAELGKWDYRREVPVTVLGRIFEQSITDIEKLKAEGRGEAAPVITKRKREGVVYTPDVITRFLVERTVGVSLKEAFDALWAKHDLHNGGAPDNEKAFWRDYVEALRGLTILDPACGSGAFLVAAFDVMAAEYRRATTRFEALGGEIDFDIFDEIVTRNLHGVDLNAESVEITRLSLWLKTARREHRLQNLEATIKTGDSLIEDAAFTQRPFNWNDAFPEVFARGRFDIVIGNPPYVRMEFIKPFKPYLEKHYVVADDRADLYAYFFEKGVKLLKDGGRLGFISSSTFFRTGSGEKLRVFLADGVGIESIVDFGDLQVFEGVTTYPAILSLKKGADGAAGDLQYLTLKDSVPDDLGGTFLADAKTMPRARLGAGSWRLEGDALAALREKIAKGRKTLGEVYGAPLYGIKTGLNEAFVIDTPTRDRLVKADPKSVEVLKPFLRGEDIKRWRVEPEGLWLINTPKGKVKIDDYPAIHDWLKPFRKALEKRATKQEWWELQQAQLAYQEKFGQAKIVYQDITAGNPFALDTSGAFLANTCYFVAESDARLLAYFNSKLAWFFFCAVTNIARGGYLRLRSDFVEQLPVPKWPGRKGAELSALGQSCTDVARKRYDIIAAVRHRILDLAPPKHRKLNGKLEAWHDLDFAGFLVEVKKALHAEVPLKQRGEWEAYLADNARDVHALTEQIETAERAIDGIVYDLFELTPEEVALLEESLAGQA